MPGPSGHGQRNKAHKAGRRAGASARQKHAAAKACHPARMSFKAGASAHPAGGKAARLQAARAMREAAKTAAAAGRRAARAAPRVVGVLGLSGDADAAGLWTALAAACLAPPPAGDDGAMATDVVLPHPTASGPVALPCVPGGGPASLLLLPLLGGRGASSDPLAVLDFLRSVDVLVLAIPGDDRAHPVALDADGEAALALLRALGPPPLVAAATLAPSSRPPDLKTRSAAKKRAAAVVADQVPGVEARPAVWWAGGDDAPSPGSADGAALARAAADARGSLPRWRAGRAGLLVEGAMHDAAAGKLTLTGTVRGAGLPAAGLVHVPGAGDFQVEAIRLLTPGAAAGPPASKAGGGMEVDAAPAGTVISVPASEREPLIRENEPAEEDGVWPAPGDLAAADAALAVAAEVEANVAAAAAARLRRLPAGTSDYQAAWLDADALREEGDEEEDGAPGPAATLGEADHPAAAWEPVPDDGATDAMDFEDDQEEEEDEAATLATRKAAARAACAAAADDAAWPDEVDTPPPGVPARARFGKFRGLASWRSSAWDPADGAPPEYARVFAFENARRAAKRAAEAAADPSIGAPGRKPGAAPGARVELVLAAVPPAAGVAIATRVAAFAAGAGTSPGAPPPPPLVAWGLLQHEGRLSVVHWAVRAAPSYGGPPLPGKAPVLFATGVRTFTARPIWSTDDHGATKFKLERFLQPGRHAVATAYAPIAHAPGPLLGFVPSPDDNGAGGGPGRWTLALTGSLRGADPDRVILKKAVLTGYPAKVHKRKAVVRWMWTSPEDVRWFAPVELWTKGGRRGRIKEPVGTHGAFKAVFDGQVAQQDAVCLSLYKRAVPPWPAETGGLFVG